MIGSLTQHLELVSLCKDLISIHVVFWPRWLTTIYSDNTIWCFLLIQVFQDIGDDYLVSSDHIERGQFLGKGAFGAVFGGTIVHQVC